MSANLTLHLKEIAQETYNSKKRGLQCLMAKVLFDQEFDLVHFSPFSFCLSIVLN
jgi:hypothetical protein